MAWRVHVRVMKCVCVGADPVQGRWRARVEQVGVCRKGVKVLPPGAGASSSCRVAGAVLIVGPDAERPPDNVRSLLKLVMSQKAVPGTHVEHMRLRRPCATDGAIPSP